MPILLFLAVLLDKKDADLTWLFRPNVVRISLERSLPDPTDRCGIIVRLTAKGHARGGHLSIKRQ